MTQLRNMVIVVLCAAVWTPACSDDGAATPKDSGKVDAVVDLKGAGEAGASDLAADIKSPPADGPGAEGGAKDKGPGKDAAAGACKEWSQWTCSLSGTKECRASCTAAGVPLQLECGDKGGKADCECKKSGVKTNCSYSGPATSSCDACKAAFKSGCCNPP